MKNILTICLLILIIYSCKDNRSNNNTLSLEDGFQIVYDFEEDFEDYLLAIEKYNTKVKGRLSQ